MKKIILLLICLLSLSLGLSLAENIDDFTYAIEDDGITITSYVGSEKKIKIPSKIGDYKVKKIGANAFLANANITKVELPSTVEEIQNSAFQDCTNLVTVVFSKNILFIADNAFDNCYNLIAKLYEDTVAQTYCINKNIPFQYAKNENTLLQIENNETTDPSFDPFLSITAMP